MGSELMNGVPLVAVVMGLVEFSKQVGVRGRGLTATAMGIGLTLGVAYQCATVMPTTGAAWFGALVYGLALGLTAAGVNDWVKQFRQPG